ncbi:LOW QUALITY PROTEIN: taste receptor type 2 member 129-like [Rattus rattus]|uniref:LOW QUALITY PROTEIN: taste receptor type 2 member 129-like n=1 Tax=Rattus rattus TaxID=10117 RepID=UPI0013F2E4AF|nr:LOW QUALITY PROTEIN: taste receptor type 2 member 129-like [Rattus rattus]
MDGIIQIIFAFIVIIEIIIGWFANGFIVLVNYMHWIKRRRISTVNQILTALAFSRIYLLLTVFTLILASVQYSNILVTRREVKLIIFHLIISNHFSMWLAACLGLFYFLKIANFSNFIFVFLKKRVNKVVSGTLLMSLVFLFLNTLLINSYIDTQIDDYRGHLLYDFTSNITVSFYRVILVINNCIFTSIPFTLSQSTFLMLIFSLWRHYKKMQQHAQRCRDALTNAHIKVLQTMIMYVLLCAIFFLFLSVQIWRNKLMENILFIRFCETVAAVFPSGHSCVLIWGDTNLRRNFLYVLWWLKHRFTLWIPKLYCRSSCIF